MNKSKIVDGVVDVWTSPKWAEFKNAQSLFPTFTPITVSKITKKMPDSTHVTDVESWAKLGRTPIEGQEPVHTFRRKEYFDLSQTEGKSLPLPNELLTGDAPAGLFDYLKNKALDLGWNVTKETLPSSVNGECRWGSKSIVINYGLSGAQEAKTIAHELGHILLHRHESDRAKAEVEAESVAFLVCDEAGLDTMPYTGGYVASWAYNMQLLNQYLTDNLEKTAKLIIN